MPALSSDSLLPFAWWGGGCQPLEEATHTPPLQPALFAMALPSFTACKDPALLC